MKAEDTGPQPLEQREVPRDHYGEDQSLIAFHLRCCVTRPYSYGKQDRFHGTLSIELPKEI